MKLELQVFRSGSIPSRKNPNYPSQVWSDATLRCRSLPNEILGWLEVNPRIPREKASAYGAIFHTLTNEPKEMFLRNKGILLSCKSWKQEGSRVTVELTHPKIHGVVDGGHGTLACVRARQLAEDMDRMGELGEAYVNLELVTGLDKKGALTLACDRNTTTNMAAYSLLNSAGFFDEIRSQVGEDCLAYCQGDTGREEIVKVIQMLLSLHVERYKDHQPNDVYRQAKHIMGIWKREMEGIPSSGVYLSRNVREVLSLRDDIVHRFVPLWNATNRAYGSTTIKGSQKGNAKSTPLILSGGTIPYYIEFVQVLPLLSAFRAAVDWDFRSNQFWKVPTDVILDACLPQLVGDMAEDWESPGVKKLSELHSNAALKNYYRTVENFVRRYKPSSKVTS